MARSISGLIMLAWLITPIAAQDDKLVATVKGLVKKMIDATVEGDYRTVIDMSHPRVIEMMGGKEEALKVVEKGMKTIKAQGFVFAIKDIGAPTITRGAKEYYSATSFTMVMTGLGKKITIKSAVVGVSGDDGKSWKFVNLDDEGEKGIKTILPDLPAALVIPKHEKKIEDNG